MSKIVLMGSSFCICNPLIPALRQAGYCTFTTADGDLGIQLSKQEKPDLVICDVTLQLRDGYFVLSQLRTTAATAILPVILIGPSLARCDLRYAMELGANDYLTRPYSIREVLRAVAAQIKRQAVLQKWYEDRVCELSEDIAPAQQTSFDPGSATPNPVNSADFVFPTNEKLAPIFAFIEANFHKPIKLEDVAAATNYSPAYMTHLVKCQTRRSVCIWILERRMVEARKLLLEGDLMVKEIAHHLGYRDPGYFTQQFKRYHEMSPTAWAEKMVNNNISVEPCRISISA